jgi:hypothetical protein
MGPLSSHTCSRKNQGVKAAEDVPDNVYSLDLAAEIGGRWYNYVHRAISTAHTASCNVLGCGVL